MAKAATAPPDLHVERQNLTIRMQMRRLMRLANAFSKKWENLWAPYCPHFAYHNFCRIQQDAANHAWDESENHRPGLGHRGIARLLA